MNNIYKNFNLPENKKKYPTGDDNVITYPDRPHYNNRKYMNMKKDTQIICFDGCPNNPYHPSVMPIYQTSTFIQPSSTEFGSYDYSRSGNPTRTALETILAGLENAYSSHAFSSGMSALNSVMRLAKHNEEIIVSSDLYGGMYRLLTKIITNMGINIKFVDTSDLNQVKKALTPKTTLIHIETPSNPLMKITDIKKISEMARNNICYNSHATILSVDSTMMSPYLMNPINLGADVVVHSATKFLGGHSDIIAGIVCVKNKYLADKISFNQNAEGTCLGPFDCWLLLRSIKTLHLRVERAQENSYKVADFLNKNPAVINMNYTGFSRNDKSNNIHIKQARGSGSVISFTTGDVKFSQRLVNACKLFKITVSFGSCNSLIELPCSLSHASIPSKERTLPEDLIRLSIGIEHIDDIINDLKQAFEIANIE